MRKNNLEFRKASYLCTPPENPSWHIDYWYPNEYYGKESEFIKDGDFYRPNDEHYSFVSIHKDCFKHPESCYAIGSFDWNENCYEFRFIGDRPMKLNEKERKTFWELIDYGYKQLNSWWYEENLE